MTGWSAPATPRGRGRRQAAIRQVRQDVPSPAEAADRITAFYLAHPERHADGRRWYEEAAEVAAAVSAAGPPGCDGPTVVAALSPQTPWSENVGLALAMAVHAAEDPCDARGRTRAEAVRTATTCPLGPSGLVGAARACEAARGLPNGPTLGGRKVRSFRANIAAPHRIGPVTIDRHALSLYFGRPLSDQAAKVLERPGTYHLVAAAYRTAARRLGLTPAALQAATWLAWRDVHSPGWAARDALLASLDANRSADLPAGF